MRKTISIEILKLYLRAYDEINGKFPESKYEGESIEMWIMECLKTN